MAHRIDIRTILLAAALGAGAHAQPRLAARIFEPARIFEKGIGCWYGSVMDGRITASGEIFDSTKLMAAHRTLPFGTKVRVHVVGSEESVVVRITDRGPEAPERVIDLSYAAAHQLGVAAIGIFPVTLELVDGEAAIVSAAPAPKLVSAPAPKPVPTPPAPAPRGVFAVQAGAFRNPDNARRTHDFLQEKFPGAVTTQQSGEFWCVLVGSAATQEEAESLAGAVRDSSPAYRTAFVTHMGR